MSNLIFPATQPYTGWNIKWPIKKTPVFNTIVQTPASGVGELRIPMFLYPRWYFDLDIGYLKSDFSVPTGALASVIGFYSQVAGSGLDWLYSDPYDNSVTAMPFAAADGVSSSYQLTRALTGVLGGGIDIIQNPVLNPLPAIFVSGVSEPFNINPPQAAPALSQVSSGSLAATTYFAMVTWTTQNGESSPSAEASLAVLVNNVLVVTIPSNPPTGAMGWNVYVGTASNGEHLQNAAPLALTTTTWQEPAGGISTGTATQPITMTSGWTIAPQTLSNPSFAAGSLTNYNVYDGNNSGKVTITATADSQSPSGTGQKMKVATASGTPAPSPGLGGFRYVDLLGTGLAGSDTYTITDTYEVWVQANIPTGYTLNFGTNGLATNQVVTALTSGAGTGWWFWYGWRVYTGINSTFFLPQNAFPYFWLTGTAPVTWYVSNLFIYNDSKTLGIVNFNKVPLGPGGYAGGQNNLLSWTGGFYWRCRFTEDQLGLKEDLYRIWSLDSLKFQSVTLASSPFVAGS